MEKIWVLVDNLGNSTDYSRSAHGVKIYATLHGWPRIGYRVGYNVIQTYRHNGKKWETE